MTATYRVVAMVTGDGRRIQAFERIEDRPTMPAAPGDPRRPMGRPRKTDAATAHRRAQYRASAERANHANGRCVERLGIACDLGGLGL